MNKSKKTIIIWAVIMCLHAEMAGAGFVGYKFYKYEKSLLLRTISDQQATISDQQATISELNSRVSVLSAEFKTLKNSVEGNSVQWGGGM